MRKKIHILSLFLALMVAVMAFVGWGKQPVELLNDNPPLIDLNAAIKEADFGQNGNTGSETGDPSKDHQGEDGNTQQGEAHHTFEIFVRDEDITFEKLIIRKVDTLKRKLEQECQVGDTVKLIDDYAEAHRYREVWDMLKPLAEERGLVLTVD